MAPAQRAFYGIDAPGVVLGFLGAGTAILLAVAGLRWAWPNGGRLAEAGTIVGLVIGLVPLMLGTMMVAYAAVGKTRMRDLMLGSVAWTGHEQVLDIGTGAGLLLVGAAKRLTDGVAVGIDIWSAKDLSNNARASTERNMLVEGVSDCAKVETADARSLPMADGTFDRVVSLLCLHNIEGSEKQAQACREIARVLKPGGVALIGDYVPTSGYAANFRAAGLKIVSNRPYFGTALSLMWMVQAEKPFS